MSTWWAKQAGAGSTTTTAPSTPAPAAPATTTTTTNAFANLFSAKKPAQQHSIPALSSTIVLDFLKTFRLEGADDKYQTSMVFAKSNDQMMGGEDASIVGLRWFRAAEGGKFEELYVTKPFFQPSIDDVDKRLCVQCYDIKDETSSSFAEYGPVKLNPKVTEAMNMPDVKVKAKTGSEELEISRSSFPPNLVVFKRNIEGSNIEDHIPSWKIIANEAKRVLLGDGREIEFATSFDRDVATLLFRTNPPRSKSGSVASLDDMLNDHRTPVESVTEKQLKERVMELEAQLMAARARGGAAETGKALAEAQSLRRELDKTKVENVALADQLMKLKEAKADLEERMRALEREAAMTTLKEQVQSNLQNELETSKEALKKAQTQAKAAKERAEKAEFSLDELDRSVPELEARAKKAEQTVAELQKKMGQLVTDAERAVGRRNAAQQKADSLAKDLARMLKATPGGLEEVEATMRENGILRSTVDDLRAELKQVRAAYEAQLASGRVNSAKATIALGMSHGGGGAAAHANKAAQLEQLANTLMSEVKAKDEVIEEQRAEVARLTLRLHELTKRHKDPSGNSSS